MDPLPTRPNLDECAFCDRRAARVADFIEEFGARPHHRVARLPACRLHIDPFKSDPGGPLVDAAYAFHAGARYVIVSTPERWRGFERISPLRVTRVR